MTGDIKKDTSNKNTYNHSICPECGKETKRSYDIVQEIKKILNKHPVPLSAREIQRYLENANYDELDNYIKIKLDHLEKLLQDITEVEIIKYIDVGHTYYMTRTQIDKRHKLLT